MASTPDNPPAFPSVEAGGPNQDWPLHFHGMTLRDWFAGQALAWLPQVGCGADLDMFDTARAVYQLSDAMLAERAK